MKKPIIEIEELGEPNSLIYRKDAKISEIVNTEKLIKELNEQLRLFGVIKAFYCQSEIEGNRKCTQQCQHCKEYYKPLDQ